MKKATCAVLVAATLTTAVTMRELLSQIVKKEDCFFLSSLHYTTNGMRHSYSKQNGGLEVITGVPYDDLSCKHCHTSGCDRCHRAEMNGSYEYSVEASKEQGICLECHGRERAMIDIDQAAKEEDVHFKRGMECMDCHSAREMHGDGTEYVSMEEPGAMDALCENCHMDVEPTTSHTVHGEKLDCKACHVRHVVSCTNCHFDVFLETGKKKAVKVSGWVFLINNKGKVTSGNMQTFVAKGDKTFMMFAPHMSHSIMAEGRRCDECHGTEAVQHVRDGEIRLTWMEEGAVRNRKGVIPVVNGTDYRCVYLDTEDEEWIPIEKHATPVYHYPAFGTPLSTDQLQRLAHPR